MGPTDVKRRIEGCVRDFLEVHDLACSSRPLVVAVSGGPDSLCLLHALDHYEEPLGLGLHVAHLNHRLRGKESDDDAAYVEGLAQQMRLPCTVGQEDVRRRTSSHSSSLEEKAREARYQFLAAVSEECGAAGVAVAHTADDQAETVLLHLLRGSGVAGLRGMQPVSALAVASGTNLTLFRPLLRTTRKDTQAYCEALGLAPRTDLSNLSTEHLRNRIRLELLPTLRDYNPNIEASLLRLAEAASLDMEFIEKALDNVWGSIVKEASEGLRIDTRELSDLAPSLQHHLLRRALETLLGDLVDIEQTHIAALSELTSKPSGKSLCLPRGVIATMEYGECLLAIGLDYQDAPPLIKGEHKLKVPGVTQVDGWVVDATVVNGTEYQKPAGGLRAALDAGVVGSDLAVRTRRPGDSFQPLGMRHSKKLQDFLVDSKVPGRLRDRVPLVCARGKIVWVVGWRID
ncbi:MAG: tRNA lysidine(34) synthetase TilS, partial [Dehalococcoidia bacterium]